MSDLKKLLETASAALGRGDPASAERAFDAVLKIDPKNPHALNSLGMRSLDSGDYRAAESFFRQAVEADSKAPALWLNLAKAQRLLDDGDGELASLNAALDLDRRHFMALLRKAELHERRNEMGAAVQAWSGVIALATNAGEVPPQVVEAVRHGQAYLARYRDELAGVLDRGLSEIRSGYTQREMRRFDAAMDKILGKRNIYSNECHGVHFPFLQADEFFDRDLFPWMSTLEARTGAIRDELRALMASDNAPLRPYVAQDPGTPENKWTKLDNSLDWGVMFLWEYGVRNDAVCARCPETVAALAQVPQCDIPGRAPTAFFSMLKPRKHIPPHTGVTNLRTIVHLPLIVPPGCKFRVGGETRPWIEGEAFAFDDTIDHEAWNDSDDLRAVLIFDVWNPHLTDVEKLLMNQFYSVTQANGLVPDPKDI